MATKFELDSKSDTIADSLCDASTLSLGVPKPMQSKRSIFSRILVPITSIVLSRIRDLVVGPNYTPSSVAPIINSCAVTLSAAKFSNLLQSCKIEGHSAIYWAIVNKRPEAFSAFIPFMSKLSSGCQSDLRRACMVVSNHALFIQLNLGRPTCKCAVNVHTTEIVDRVIVYSSS